MRRALLVAVPLCCAQYQSLAGKEHATHQNQILVAADEHALLQARVKLRSPQSTTAAVLLENVQTLALNINSQSPDTVTALVASITATIQGMKPLLQTEHDAAQSQLDAQFAEIGACSSNATHGTGAVEDAVDDLAAQRADVTKCAADKASAATARDDACAAWKRHAESTYTAFPTSLSGSPDPNDILSKIEAWDKFAEDELPDMISKKAACTNATAHYASEESRCLTVKSQHDAAFCDHQAKCVLLQGCHRHEVSVYDSLNATSETAAAARQSQFRTLSQVECLLGLITTAVEGNSTIASDEMNSCDKNAAVDDLVLSVPTAQSLSPCPARKQDDPQCPAVQMPPLWSESDAELGWQLISKQDGAKFHSSARTTYLENPDHPESNTYMIVGNIDSQSTRYKHDGKYKFKLVSENPVHAQEEKAKWEDKNTLIWEQTSWLTETSIDGFSLIEGPDQYDGNIDGTGVSCWGFRGLARSDSAAVFDGNGGSNCWFNAVGATSLHWDGMPSFNGVWVSKVQLYIRDYAAASPGPPPPSPPPPTAGPKYKRGEWGKVGCPAGYTPVLTEAGCKAVGESMGKTFAYARAWANDPEGCIMHKSETHGHVYLNTHPSPADAKSEAASIWASVCERPN